MKRERLDHDARGSTVQNPEENMGRARRRYVIARAIMRIAKTTKTTPMAKIGSAGFMPRF
jgi:hypothetical protein